MNAQTLEMSQNVANNRIKRTIKINKTITFFVYFFCFFLFFFVFLTAPCCYVTFLMSFFTIVNFKLLTWCW